MYFVVVHKKKIVKLVHYVEPYLFCFPSARGFPLTEVQCSFERSSIPFFTTLYICRTVRHDFGHHFAKKDCSLLYLPFKPFFLM